MIPNKSSQFNKIPTGTGTFLLKTKIKYLLFGLKTKISSKILLFPLKKCVFFLDPDWEKIPGSGSVKTEHGSATLLPTLAWIKINIGRHLF